jgi:hypothetical protein
MTFYILIHRSTLFNHDKFAAQGYQYNFHQLSSVSTNMASSNPANFANLPKDELRNIAAKGGHASHGGSVSSDLAQHTSSYPHKKRHTSPSRNDTNTSPVHHQRLPRRS